MFGLLQCLLVIAICAAVVIGWALLAEGLCWLVEWCGFASWVESLGIPRENR